MLMSFQRTDIVLNEKIVVFALYDAASLCILQSEVHRAWTLALSSTLKTDLQYTPSRCFETFPFPALTPERRRELDSIGEAFHLYRAQLQRDRGLGLTKLWNLVVDPANGDADIEMLRGLKAEMDRAVLDAYGWPEVDPGDSREIVRRLRRLNAERARGG